MENTNKTLALLLVAAIVVSLGGTIISLQKLGQISVTGKATTSGTATVVVSQTYVVNLTDTSIHFGTGSLTEGVADCRIYSNGTEIPTSCWTGTAADSTLRWHNTGSTTMFVDIQSSATPANFVGGDSPEFQFKCRVTNGGTTYGYTSFAAAATDYACADTVTVTGNGSTEMYVNVSSGASAASGTRVATITFTAAAS